VTSSLSLLKLNANTSSTQEKIILTLCDKWPLSAREICNTLQKQYAAEITYQAVHKLLKTLEKEKIIERSEKGYRMNLEWVRKVKHFSEQIEMNYVKDNKFDSESDLINLEFYSLFEFLRTMLHIFSSDVLPGADKGCFGAGIMKHIWWPLSFEKDDFEKFKIMGGDHQSYLVCTSNSLVDQWLKEFYVKTGFDGVVLGTDFKHEDDIAVVGDSVLHIYFPEEIKMGMHKIYTEAKDISDVINNDFLEKMFNEKVKINVTVVKNKEVAAQMRDKILSYFKGGKK